MRFATVGFCLSLALSMTACATGAPSLHGVSALQVTRVSAVTEPDGADEQVPPTVVLATTNGSRWLDAAAEQQALVVGADGSLHIGIWVRAPQAAPQVVARRVPMDVALVVDVSGSMAGEKIAHARMAASSFIESLADGDIVSVYAFSDRVMEIAAPTTVGSGTRGMLAQRVSQLQPMGSTNLYDGLRVGEARASEAPSTHAVRRVVLISDGMANVGPSSPDELGRVASDGSERNVQVSSIGVGLDYDEATLGAIAMRSAGRMYHLAQPSQMATILQQELQTLAQTVATEAVIELEPAPGVELLDAENVSAEHVAGGRLRVRLGSLRGGQVSEVLVRARASTQGPGERPLANARLVLHPAGASSVHREEVALRYGITRDTAAASRAVDGRVQAMAANFAAANAQLNAARALNTNNAAEADVQLANAERQLREAAARPTIAAPARAVLLQRAEGVHRSRSTVRARPAASRATSLDLFDDAMNAYGH